jgi:hypothetical protein
MIDEKFRIGDACANPSCRPHRASRPPRAWSQPCKVKNRKSGPLSPQEPARNGTHLGSLENTILVEDENKLL